MAGVITFSVSSGLVNSSISNPVIESIPPDEITKLLIIGSSVHEMVNLPSSSVVLSWQLAPSIDTIALTTGPSITLPE